MKKTYTQAKIELLLLTTADVITASIDLASDPGDGLEVGWKEE